LGNGIGSGGLVREIIQLIVAAEAEARRIVAVAEDEATRIAAQAEKEAQQTLARARALTRDETAELVRAAVREAERERERLLGELDVELEAELRLDDERRREAVAAVVHSVRTVGPVRAGERAGGRS
jgi:vacuolar-type H+-ATPase subunit H